ncbi:MAG: hypothetical protein WBE42_20365, partial [Pseudolabrys sp.]
PLLGAGKEAVLSAGKDSPLGVRIRCLLDCIRNAKQYLGLALIGAARQKQCQTDNGKVSFPASQKSYQNKISHSYAYATTCGRYIARTGTQQLCKRYSK